MSKESQELICEKRLLSSSKTDLRRKNKMDIISKLIGIGLMITGIAIWGIDYFIVKAIANIGTWLAIVMNAPAGVGTGITVIICILLLGVLAMVAIAGGYVFCFGIETFAER